MRQFHTAVLDTFHEITPDYATEPFETAWASEATFFVRAEVASANTGDITFAVELSPDGITWVDEGGRLVLPQGEQLAFVRIRHFGGWLRLRYLEGALEENQTTVYLVLKE